MKKLFYKTSLKHATLFKKETPTQIFSYEYCEIFKSTYFDEHLRTAASKEYKILSNKYLLSILCVPEIIAWYLF